jgi:GMP synthase (glutamine-hydrolysing)
MKEFILIIDNAESSKYVYHKLGDYLKKQKIRFIEVQSVADLYSMKHLWSKVSGIILTGSDRLLSSKQYVKDIAKNTTAVQLIKKPVLGICYGFQLLNLMLGGEIINMDSLCDKLVNVKKFVDHPLLDGMPAVFKARCYNNDKITRLSSSFKLLCRSRFINQGFYDDENKYYGLQFHPENNKNTQIILNNFIYSICKYKN